MKEAYFDPALQKHKERQALIRKWQHRRAFLKKYRGIVAGAAASIAIVSFAAWKIAAFL